MRSPASHLARIHIGIACIATFTGLAHAQEVTCYGVNASGALFRFPRSSPISPIVTIGNLGFVPEDIDFRPGSNTLYALDVGSASSRLYTVDIASGAATPVGAPFPSSVPGSYNLMGGAGVTYGIDADPTSLQPDGSITIRLVTNTGQNLRLNSATGQVAGVDSSLQLGVGAASIDAIAYSRSGGVGAGGLTVLYGLDFGADALVRLDSPGLGTAASVGSLGASFNVIAGSHFDIFTTPTESGPGIAYATFRTAANPTEWMMAPVNLTTGAIFFASPVGTMGGNPAADFTGGFSVNLPGPSAAALLLIAGTGALRRRRPA